MPLGEEDALKFVTDPLYGDHLRGVGHPERPDRVEVVAARLRAQGAIGEELPARDATREDILRVHAAAYLALVEREAGGAVRPRELSTGDVVVGPGSLPAALRAAGGAIAAMDAAVTGGEGVFALVRPPGHHAEPGRGMGFCLFNNAAVAARAFQAAYGGRVLIVDFDFHHGNGTEAVAGDGLSYVSTHAFPAYPMTGTRSYRRGADVVANVPLPAAGVPTEAFVAAWKALLPPVAALVRPDLLIVSAGFDFAAGDPVGDLGVAPAAAGPLAAAIRAVAGEYCGGRVAYVLEGGYSLDALTESIARVVAENDRGTWVPSGPDPAAVPAAVGRALRGIS